VTSSLVLTGTAVRRPIASGDRRERAVTLEEGSRMIRSVKVGLVGAMVLLPGAAACSAEDRESLTDSARETASSVQDQANTALDDATSQLDDAASDLQSQATGLDDQLQSSVGDLNQQAEQLASDVRAEGQDISEATKQSAEDLRGQVDQVDEQLNAADPSAAVASAWEAFKQRIDDLVDQVLNAGG
jgi:gas vesicle protein